MFVNQNYELTAIFFIRAEQNFPLLREDFFSQPTCERSEHG
jgi:hypothetical protein